MNSKLIKFAASSLAIAVTTVGCKPATSMYRPAAASAKAAKANAAALDAYNDAQAALRKGKLNVALASMEQAVAWAPQDAGYRKGLAEMYLKSGRFASAETTYADVVALNPDDSKAGFYLALTRIAQGKTQAALDQLQRMDPSVAPADLGLAFAIAGDPRRALELLEPAARSAESNGRVRQNLALAYALAGDWKKARLTAAQDVSPSDLNKRMAQWAAIADPAASASRVATLLNVTPVGDDPGQPARLALAPAASNAPALAEASELVPAEVAVADAPARAVFPPTVADIEQSATVYKASYVQAAQSLITPALSETPRIVPTPIPAFTNKRTPKLATGRYVVQIGAFKSSGQVERAWGQAQRRYGFAGQQPLTTTVRIDGVGVMHRLAVSGFASQTAAVRVCQSIRARNGACFVRTVAGDAPIQWASRSARKA